LRLFSFGGYGLALAALALVVFGAFESYPDTTTIRTDFTCENESQLRLKVHISTIGERRKKCKKQQIEEKR